MAQRLLTLLFVFGLLVLTIARVHAEQLPAGIFGPRIYQPLLLCSGRGSDSTTGLIPFETQVIELVNSTRANPPAPYVSCAPLSVNSMLTAAARSHSKDMALNDFFSHTGSDGSNTAQRITAQGYAYRAWSENIAAGETTPAAIVEGWMKSESHRNNILNCTVTEIGVGYYYQADDQPLPGSEFPFRHYWTQVFAAPQ